MILLIGIVNACTTTQLPSTSYAVSGGGFFANQPWDWHTGQQRYIRTYQLSSFFWLNGREILSKCTTCRHQTLSYLSSSLFLFYFLFKVKQESSSAEFKKVGTQSSKNWCTVGSCLVHSRVVISARFSCLVHSFIKKVIFYKINFTALQREIHI